MKMLNGKKIVIDFFQSLLKQNIIVLIADDKEFELENGLTNFSFHKCEEIIIKTNKEKISICTFEIPHIFGEVDLQIEKSICKEFSEFSNLNIIDKIQLHFFNPKGKFEIFKREYLLQADFFFNFNSLSIGLFEFERDNFNFLYTGEIAVSANISIDNINISEFGIISTTILQ